MRGPSSLLGMSLLSTILLMKTYPTPLQPKAASFYPGRGAQLQEQPHAWRTSALGQQ